MVGLLIFAALGLLVMLATSNFADSHIGGDVYTAGETLAIYRRVKFSGSNSRTVIYADSGEDAVAVTDQAADEGDPVNLVFITSARSIKVEAAATMATANAVFYGAADGKVSNAAVGSALGVQVDTASASGSIIECLFLQCKATAAAVTNPTNVIEHAVTSGDATTLTTTYLAIASGYTSVAAVAVQIRHSDGSIDGANATGGSVSALKAVKNAGNVRVSGTGIIQGDTIVLIVSGS